MQFRTRAQSLGATLAAITMTAAFTPPAWAQDTVIAPMINPDPVVGGAPKPLPEPERQVPLGTAIWWGCADPTYEGRPQLACKLPYDSRYERAARSFDHFVPENEMKELWVHPAEDRWDFTEADELVQWAQSQGKTVRGHALIFGDATPFWKGRPDRLVPWTRDTLLLEMRKHITNTMRHFKEKYPGVVTEWDVVNEAWEDWGAMDSNVYRRVIGPDYVEKAFRYARAADPDAVLIYNEYNADRPGSARAEAVYDMVVDFRARGVPIDGVGLQMHLGTAGNYPTGAELHRQFERYRALGLRVEYTETDVGITPTPAGLDPFEEQKDVYREIAEDCRDHGNCTGFTVWGVADPHSWRGPAEKPLLFGDDMLPKDAYTVLRAHLHRSR